LQHLGLLLLQQVKPAAALGDIRWEKSRSGELFPHLYGPLEIARAAGSWWLAAGQDGAPVVPEDV
jgi:uncharacterized protein (DUF952 family)